MNLETDNKDSGNIIISSNKEDIQKVFDLFVKNGEDNELNPCESVYIIIEAESKLFWNKFERLDFQIMQKMKKMLEQLLLLKIRLLLLWQITLNRSQIFRDI